MPWNILSSYHSHLASYVEELNRHESGQKAHQIRDTEAGWLMCEQSSGHICRYLFLRGQTLAEQLNLPGDGRLVKSVVP